MTYISGPTTGIEDNNRAAFMRADDMIRKTDKVFNPALVSLPAGASWENYMRFDITGLMLCDSIYMLKGWQKSRGAKIEHELAIALDMKIYYQVDEYA